MRELRPRDLVVELLKTLDLAQTDWDARSGSGGVILMPSLYHQGSYQELEHRLSEMRDDPAWRKCWWHASMRYRWGLITRESVAFRKTSKGLVPVLPARSELLIQGQVVRDEKRARSLMIVQLYRWSADVEPGFVDAGISRLLATMYDGDTTKLRLPRELLYLALGVESGGERGQGDQPGSRDVQSPALAASSRGG